jgi:transposase
MDMLHCYAKGVREQLPKAQIVYDRYRRSNPRTRFDQATGI